MSIDLTNTPEFRPLTGSRQIEYILWGAVGLFIGLIIFIPGYVQDLNFWSWVLGLFFVAAAFSISINNWNMKHTKIMLFPDEIQHYSKLRNVSIKWKDINRVQVNHGRLGDKIIVSGETGAFFFDSLSEIKVKGDVKEKTGFEKGEEILDTILSQAGFSEMDKKEGSGFYYYSKI